MTLTVEINHPDFEKDVEFDLAGIAVPNEGKVELTEDQERALVARRQQPAKEALSGNQFVKVTGSSALSSKDLESIIVESNFGPSPEERAAAEAEVAAEAEKSSSTSTTTAKNTEGSDG